MAKTYIPGAVTFAEKLQRYLTRYLAKLSSDQTVARLAALNDLITCLGEFLVAWQKPPVGP